jgi:penicillin-binding protein 1C
MIRAALSASAPILDLICDCPMAASKAQRAPRSPISRGPNICRREAALLVALPQAPETRRPDRKPKLAAEARNRVIVRLRNDGIINADQAEAAAIESAPKGRLAFPMLAAHVAERLAKSAPDGTVEQTTIARDLQASLETLARERALAIGSGVAAAIIVVDNDSGVRAHVGGTGFFDMLRAGQMDLAQALRSPGSTLKPFIYGLAFEDGVVHPETLIDDRAIRYGAYAPENFDDSFHGTVTVRTALQQSLNVPALQILNTVGPDRLMARIGNAGVKLVLPKDAAAPGLAVGLGGAGVRLTELAAVSLAGGAAAIQTLWSGGCRITTQRKAPPVRAERRLDGERVLKEHLRPPMR